MKAQIKINSESFEVDFSKPLDISMCLRPDPKAASAWYVPPVKIDPVRGDGFIGDVNQGGSVNFYDIFFNPHGNGTHTECVGHISKEHESINDHLKMFMYKAQVVTISPEEINGDRVITNRQMQEAVQHEIQAVVIRTLPNSDSKLTRQYSNTNPPYVEAEAMNHLNRMGVDHFLIDLPSIDKEKDDGILAAHHAFWNYPEAPHYHKTITELIYVPDEIEDGMYLLNLQMASFENDASPSKPVLYKIIQ